jgi:AcrR family transcriptional regulator
MAEAAARSSPGDGARARIRQAALDLFLEHGFHGTSMRQIARRAGISLAAIYNHIPSKEALFVELLSELVPHRGLVAAVAEARGDTVEALINDATRRIGDALVENQVNMRLMFVELLEFKGRHAPSLAEEFLPGAGALVTRLQEADGRLRPYPPVLVARAFFGLVMSYAVSVAFFKDIPLLEFGPEDLKDFGHIFLHGILEAEASGAAQPATG